MTLQLDKDMKQLLFFLLRENEWTTGEEIAANLGWSKKKVQQLIRKTEESAEGKCVIQSKKNRGYYLQTLDDELKHTLLSDLSYNEINFNLNHRKVMLATDLLFRQEYVSMDKLAEQYFVSKTVIFEEMKALKRWFNRINGLDLEVSPIHGIKIHGKELIKRYWSAV